MVASPLEVESEEVSEEVESALARLEAHAIAETEPPAAPLARTTTSQDVDLDKIARISRAMVASGYFQDVRSVAQAAVKILAGSELGIGAFAAMSGIYVVQGRVTLSANVMAGLIKRSGKYDYRIREHDRAHCKIEFFQKVDGHWESVGFSEYSVQDAKQAGLYRSGNRGPSAWEAHPDAMCFARSLSRGARWMCPDILSGPVYEPEELEEETEGREPPAES